MRPGEEDRAVDDVDAALGVERMLALICAARRPSSACAWRAGREVVRREQAAAEAQRAGFRDLLRDLLGQHRAPHVAGRALAEDAAGVLRQHLADEGIEQHRLEFDLGAGGVSVARGSEARARVGEALRRQWRRARRLALARSAAKSPDGAFAPRAPEPLGRETLRVRDRPR